jgi:hypothetical protein
VISLPEVSPPKLSITSPFSHRFRRTYTTNEPEDVGLDTRVVRSPRLMTLVVSGGGNNQWRKVNPSCPHPRKLLRMAINQDDLWPRPTFSCILDNLCSVVMWIWLVQVWRRNECNQKRSTVLFSCWRPGGEFVLEVALSKDIHNQC